MKTIAKRYAEIIIAGALIAVTSGCGSLNLIAANQASLNHDPKHGHNGKNDINKPEAKDDWFLVDMSKKFGLMSLFAMTAYRYDLPQSQRDENGCAYLDNSQKGDPSFGMPNDKGSNPALGHWERWVPKSPTTADKPACLDDKKSGLFYETYAHRGPDGKITEAVLAYRGTENRDGQTVKDWGTDFANFFGFEPAQYALARENVQNLVDHLYRDNAGAKMQIYAVGHSLGGGLAQQAGYLSKGITEVFTFNTSPVTNWSHLRSAGLIKQGYPIIHRIHEGGEALAGIRGVATASTGARFGRYDVGVQFDSKALVKGHLIPALTCNFAKILSEVNVQDAAHNYPLSFIEHYVMTPKGELEDDAKLRRKTDRRVCDDDNTDKPE